jgi:FG-GAP-like repeat/PKD domain
MNVSSSRLVRGTVVMCLVLVVGLATVPAAGAFTLRRIPGSPYVVPGSPGSSVVGDFNADGRQDLAVESASYFGGETHGYVSVLLGSPDGGFTAATGSPISLGSAYGFLTVGDFNGDGVPDLVLSDRAAGEVLVLLGHGDGTFMPPPGLRTAVGRSPDWSAAVGDYNEDGKSDLAVANVDDTVSILLGRGDGTFTQAPGSPVPLGIPSSGPGLCCSVATGDFNGDGRLDFAVSAVDNNGQASLSVLLGHGDGTFTAAQGSPIALNAGAVPGRVSVADFNSDGRPDVAVAGDPYSSVSVLLGRGDGTFIPAPGSPIILPAGAYPTGSAVADFNGDRKLDIAFATGLAGGLWVALGDGTGGFSFANGSPFTEVQPGLFPSVAALGNFDGRVGLVVDLYPTDGGNGAVDVLLSPLASDPPAAALAVSSNPTLTGRTVKFDASASGDPLDRTIVDYRWDLGGGTFNHDTGTNPRIDWTYSAVGLVHARVLVTNAAGETGIAGVELDVRPASPRGPVGLSINNGDYATNTPKVKLKVVWPAFASDALISNDGGFNAAGATKQVPLAATIPWTLRSEGRERLPKIVYLRFPDTANPTQTFTDDIILDTRIPVIQSAKAIPTSSAASAARTKKRLYRVRLSATELLSGISAAQLSATRSGGAAIAFTNRKRHGIRRLTRIVSLRMAKRPHYVRVCSTAGNWSKWHRIR